MPPITPGKLFKEMTKRELILMVIWFTILCGIVLLLGVRELVSSQPEDSTLKQIGMIVAPLLLMSAVWVGVVQEFKTRKRK